MNHNRFWANDNGTTAGRSTGHQRLQPTRPPTDARRQLGNRGRLEQGAHRKPGIKAGVDCGDHPHRQQRIPTQVEKRVIHPDPLDAQHLGIDTGQQISSVSVCGARNGVAANTGAGSALRSILPEEVNGNSSSTTICDGTMYSGNRALNC